ncbi:MAG: TetR/AcrR family transcriptional regulator [Clostridia bacterium]|nr:TetR/AcrR family transcriptional regulator [Clostridia bacterium]
MRAVASRSGIAVGSIYNYFPAKSDQISATVQKGSTEYPSFFTHHSMSFSDDEKSTGREIMLYYVWRERYNIKG